MSSLLIQGPSGPPASGDPREALRRVSKELEGLFLRQLLESMRDGLPEESSFGGSMGEEMFTDLLDDHMSSMAAQKMERGLGAAIYRQLSRLLPPEETS